MAYHSLHPPPLPCITRSLPAAQTQTLTRTQTHSTHTRTLAHTHTRDHSRNSRLPPTLALYILSLLSFYPALFSLSSYPAFLPLSMYSGFIIHPPVCSPSYSFSSSLSLSFLISSSPFLFLPLLVLFSSRLSLFLYVSHSLLCNHRTNVFCSLFTNYCFTF